MSKDLRKTENQKMFGNVLQQILFVKILFRPPSPFPPTLPPPPSPLLPPSPPLPPPYSSLYT